MPHSYSSLQGIADASIALRLLRSSFVIFARLKRCRRRHEQEQQRGLNVLLILSFII